MKRLSSLLLKGNADGFEYYAEVKEQGAILYIVKIVF